MVSISFRDHIVLSLPPDLHGQKNDAYSCSWFQISHYGTHFLKPRKQSQNEKETADSTLKGYFAQ